VTGIRRLAIGEVLEIVPPRFGDARGWFSETYSRRTLLRAGVDLDFVQDNRSFSAAAGTLRGLHYQEPPAAQDKLVSVLAGAIFDVAVDIRRSSPTFGRHVCLTLTAFAGNQILIPKGFAHGFLTLEPNTEVMYKVTNFYSREHDHGLAWNDPDLAIPWPLQERSPILSDKDAHLPQLGDVAPPFL